MIALAIRYWKQYWGRSLLLSLALLLAVALPLFVELMLRSMTHTLQERAESTPYLIGSPASRFDLTFAALFHRQGSFQKLTWSDFQELQQQTAAKVIPVFQPKTSRKDAIVGIDSRYLPMRGMSFSEGEGLKQLGDCLIGSAVQALHQVGPGDQLLTQPTSLLDVSARGQFALNISGVLATAHTAEDRAVFVSLETAWVLAGLGHGHMAIDSLSEEQARQLEHESVEGSSSLLPTSQQFNAETLKSFHFHGDRGEFPIDYLIVVPADQTEALLLEGKVRHQSHLQWIRPAEVVEELLTQLLQLTRLLQSVLVLVGLACLSLAGLILSLNWNSRKSERETLYRMGVSRMQLAQLFAYDLLLLALPVVLLMSLMLLLLPQVSAGVLQVLTR